MLPKDRGGHACNKNAHNKHYAQECQVGLIDSTTTDIFETQLRQAYMPSTALMCLETLHPCFGR